MRLLIIDDSDIIREKLRELLNDLEKLEIVGEASDGLDGVEQFWKYRPDIVVLDLRMPKLDGIQVLQNIRTFEYPLVIIVLTNYSNDYFKDVCYEGGADYFLDKTSEFEKVYEICEKLIQKREEENTSN